MNLKENKAIKEENKIKYNENQVVIGDNKLILKYTTKEDYDFFKEILIPETIGGKEYLIKDTLIAKLEELGFKITIDSMGNIAATRGDAKVYAMLNAHMDIVDCSWGYGYGSFNKYSKKTKAKNKAKKKSLSPFTDAMDEAEYRLEKIMECSEMSDYDNSYDFYTGIYEEINFCRAKHDDKEKFLTEIFDVLQEDIDALTSADYDNMGLDCMSCSNPCKNHYTCREFTFGLKTNFDKEVFLEKLESYCILVMEEIEQLADEAMAYELSCVDDYNYGFDCDEYEYEEEEDDTEAVEPEYDVIMDFKNDKIYGKGKTRVLGGDDKCGIFIALKVAELLRDMPMKILFTVREESGCVGIAHFEDNSPEFFSDVKYSLTIDRRDKDNLLWSQLGTRSCDDEFAGKVAREGVKEGIAVKLMDGSVADVIHIRNHVPNSINMSAGYYEAHTSREYIVPSHLDKIVGWVKNILTNV